MANKANEKHLEMLPWDYDKVNKMAHMPGSRDNDGTDVAALAVDSTQTACRLSGNHYLGDLYLENDHPTMTRDYVAHHVRTIAHWEPATTSMSEK